MADNHETPEGMSNEFTGYVNVAGFPKGRGLFFFVDRVGWVGSQFMTKTPLLEGGSDDPSKPETYVESSTRYEVAVKYGSQITIAALIKAGLLPEEGISDARAEELYATLRGIEENSTDGMKKEQ